MTRHTLDAWRQIVQRLCGLDVSEDKAYLFEQRLPPVMAAAGCRDLDELARLVEGRDGRQWHDAVIEVMTTHETSFFRDTHPFDNLRLVLLPRLAEQARNRSAWHSGPKLRLWSAAASTGQEPYSLAMTVLDFLQGNPGCGLSADDVRIVATDISPRVLATAATGLYPEREVARGLSDGRLRRHFEKVGDDWRVRADVRRLVEFRPLNLVQPLRGLGPYDLILCRNVLIYFDTETRRRVVDGLADALAPGGILLLGAAENLYHVSDRFVSRLCGATIVYERRA